jgi:hypothetical protein
MSDTIYSKPPEEPIYTGAPDQPLPGHQQWYRFRGGPWMCCWVHDDVVDRPGTDQSISKDHPRLTPGPKVRPPSDPDPAVQAFVNLEALCYAIPDSGKFGHQRDRFLEQIKAGLAALGWSRLEVTP